ncbi:MAG TPA: hypothetical protein VF718_01390 [Allosphingosinicella sp.]
MTALRRFVQLALAALLASAGGGLVLIGLLGLVALGAAAGDGPRQLIAALPLLAGMTFVLAGLVAVQAASTLWLPAFLAGAALWSAGLSRPGARRPAAWAAAGAALALACHLRLARLGALERSLFALPPAAIAIAFPIAGAIAALLFRSAMAAAAPFLGLDEATEDGEPATLPSPEP